MRGLGRDECFSTSVCITLESSRFWNIAGMVGMGVGITKDYLPY